MQPERPAPLKRFPRVVVAVVEFLASRRLLVINVAAAARADPARPMKMLPPARRADPGKILTVCETNKQAAGLNDAVGMPASDTDRLPDCIEQCLLAQCVPGGAALDVIAQLRPRVTPVQP